MVDSLQPDPGLDLFAGDGGDPGQVAGRQTANGSSSSVRRCSPAAGALNGPNFWQPGVFHSEHLVNMSQHNYKQEPNVRFSPDKSMVIFTGNMFGPSYVFGVEVNKMRNPPASELQSTPELAKKFNPREPHNVNVPAPELTAIQP